MRAACIKPATLSALAARVLPWGFATVFLGGEAAFAGAPVGCTTGNVSAVLEERHTAVYAIVGGGVTYLWENHVANSEYQSGHAGVQPDSVRTK
jgi:hypothetical protein